MDKKVGRNDPCSCGSGKKYKKCCEAKHKYKKFEARVLSSSPISGSFFQKSDSVSNLFSRNIKPVTPLQPSPEEPKEEPREAAE